MSISTVLGAVAACLLSVSAHAADKSRWTEIGNVPAAAFYADYTTAKRKDGYINVWLLINYKGKNKTSHRTLQDIDCGESRMRVTYRALSAKPFGEGEVLDTVNTPDAQWQPLVPQSAYARVAEEVCKAVGGVSWPETFIKKPLEILAHIPISARSVQPLITTRI